MLAISPSAVKSADNEKYPEIEDPWLIKETTQPENSPKLRDLPECHKETESTWVALANYRLLRERFHGQGILPEKHRNIYLNQHVWEEAFTLWEKRSPQKPLFTLEEVKRARIRCIDGVFSLCFKGPKALVDLNTGKYVSLEEKPPSSNPLAKVRLESPSVTLTKEELYSLCRHGAAGVLEKDRYTLLHLPPIVVTLDLLHLRALYKSTSDLGPVLIDIESGIPRKTCELSGPLIGAIERLTISSEKTYYNADKLSGPLSAFRLATKGISRKRLKNIILFLKETGAVLDHHKLSEILDCITGSSFSSQEKDYPLIPNLSSV